jgi:predicted secreted protein
VFRFAAAASGQTTLTLLYHRSFEPDVPPLKTFTAPIVVR